MEVSLDPWTNYFNHQLRHPLVLCSPTQNKGKSCIFKFSSTHLPLLLSINYPKHICFIFASFFPFIFIVKHDSMRATVVKKKKTEAVKTIERKGKTMLYSSHLCFPPEKIPLLLQYDIQTTKAISWSHNLKHMLKFDPCKIRPFK